MKRILFAGAAVLALSSGSALADGHLMFAPGEGGFNWDSFEAFAAGHDYSGQTLTLTGPWTGPDTKMWLSVLDYFAAATGAAVQYSGSDSFEQDIVIAAQANSAPNIAIFPQPGLAADMAARGFLTPLAEGTAAWVADNYAAGRSWVDLGSYPGADGAESLYGFFYKVEVKSLVWYSPEAFDEAGYEIPRSMEELIALSERIVSDGGTPWCIGLGSGAATGWPATDWVEDIMLRTQRPEVYDRWVANEMPFDDPAVVKAIELFGSFARNDDFVSGGAEAVASTDFRDSPTGLFSVPPGCYMHRQASFIPTFFPQDADSDFFYFPSFAGKDLGNPVLGAGTSFAITRDAPAAHGLIAFLQTPIAHEVWMAQSGFLTPFQAVNPEVFTNADQRKMNEILLGATTFRFDASDLMPGEIGAGAFWTGMVDYVTGADAGKVAADIQDRWDAIRQQ